MVTDRHNTPHRPSMVSCDVKSLFARRQLLALALGQAIALLITLSGVTSTQLQGHTIHMPLGQMLATYTILAVRTADSILRGFTRAIRTPNSSGLTLRRRHPWNLYSMRRKSIHHHWLSNHRRHHHDHAQTKYHSRDQVDSYRIIIIIIYTIIYRHHHHSFPPAHLSSCTLLSLPAAATSSPRLRSAGATTSPSPCSTLSRITSS